MLILVHTKDSASTIGEYEVTLSPSSTVKNNGGGGGGGGGGSAFARADALSKITVLLTTQCYISATWDEVFHQSVSNTKWLLFFSRHNVLWGL